jgi:aminoglycoside N3'-acetyltransferase
MATQSEITPLTQAEIEKGLRFLGLSCGMAIEVHSSLSSMGFVEGGAASVVDALMNIVGVDGAIVMSAYPVSKPLPVSSMEKEKGILAKVRIFDEAYTGPSGMGEIADEFRRRPGTILGKGIHRVCAWGKNAEMHSKGYDYLLGIDGYVLLIGVGIDRCSSMHLAEKKGLPAEIAEYFKVPDDIRSEYTSDIHIAYGRTPEDGWGKVLAAAEKRGLVNRHTIGQAKCMLFKASPVIGIYESALRTDPMGLFGIMKK